ncbi:tetratricopeptide repeat protein [Fulvivirga maritima]|uniref:tetratricopeptide repeat protein n=1 Tax=Fulvivirga maritima TaxID=2904247 RepID=UPI001F379C3D|nr:tetratricopeptide repeat protein [Fulvivirga maritima]UII27040.1 tetratricopeptide repeat protein [Fulvivirga maritima]
MNRYTIIFFVFFTIAFACNGQYLDSLEKELKTATNEEKVDILNKLFVVHHQLNPKPALEYASQALDLASSIDYKKGKAAALNNLGVIYKNQGVYNRALEYYKTSLKLSEEINDKRAIASTTNNLGAIYSLKGDHEMALTYFTTSIELFTELDDQKQIIGALNNLGNAYNDDGKKIKALQYFNESIELAEQLGITSRTPEPLNNIGNIYFYNKDFEKALEYYERSYEAETKSDNILGQAQALSNIAATYYETQQLPKAKTYYQQAEQLADSISAYMVLVVTYDGLSKIYAQQEKYKEAYEARLNYDQTQEIIYTQEKGKNSSQLEIATELQQKEKELEVLKKQNRIKQLQIEKSRIVIILSIMGVIMILGAIFILIKAKKVKFKF